jgi:hypothetical protein
MHSSPFFFLEKIATGRVEIAHRGPGDMVDGARSGSGWRDLSRAWRAAGTSSFMRARFTNSPLWIVLSLEATMGAFLLQHSVRHFFPYSLP